MRAYCGLKDCGILHKFRGKFVKKGRKEAKVGTTFRGILKVEEKKSWQLKRKLRNVRACVRVRVRESCVKM